MKRKPALQALSHDHHHGLVQARRLEALPDTADDERVRDTAAAFVEFWRSDGNAHFQVEETLLLPIYARRGDMRRAEIVAMLAQHAQIRRDALAVALALDAEQTPSPGALRDLGGRLKAHIRFEEREVFPLIEQLLTEDDLSLLGRLVERHGTAW